MDTGQFKHLHFCLSFKQQANFGMKLWLAVQFTIMIVTQILQLYLAEHNNSTCQEGYSFVMVSSKYPVGV